MERCSKSHSPYPPWIIENDVIRARLQVATVLDFVRFRAIVLSLPPPRGRIVLHSWTKHGRADNIVSCQTPSVTRHNIPLFSELTFPFCGYPFFVCFVSVLQRSLRSRLLLSTITDSRRWNLFPRWTHCADPQLSLPFTLRNGVFRTRHRYKTSRRFHRLLRRFPLLYTLLLYGEQKAAASTVMRVTHSGSHSVLLQCSFTVHTIILPSSLIRVDGAPVLPTDPVETSTLVVPRVENDRTLIESEMTLVVRETMVIRHPTQYQVC